MSPKKSAQLAILVASACLGFVACGGDSGGAEPESTEVTASAVDTTEQAVEETSVDTTAASANQMSIADFCGKIEALAGFNIDFNTITEQQMLDKQAEYAEIVAALPSELPEGVRSDVEFLSSWIDQSIEYFASLNWDNASFSFDDYDTKVGFPVTFELKPWTSMNCP